MNELVINIESPSRDEVMKAIKSLKNDKAAGLDNTHAELLKNAGEPVIQELTDLCATVWESKEVPADWKDGVILPIPKKGDLADCNNWRGVTLLSVPGTVMAIIILERI